MYRLKIPAGAGLGVLLSWASGSLGITANQLLLTVWYFPPKAGTLLRLVANRYLDESFVENKGIPIIAGLIVGEALVGVGFAVKMIADGFKEKTMKALDVTRCCKLLR